MSSRVTAVRVVHQLMVLAALAATLAAASCSREHPAAPPDDADQASPDPARIEPPDVMADLAAPHDAPAPEPTGAPDAPAPSVDAASQPAGTSVDVPPGNAAPRPEPAAPTLLAPVAPDPLDAPGWQRLAGGAWLVAWRSGGTGRLVLYHDAIPYSDGGRWPGRSPGCVPTRLLAARLWIDGAGSARRLEVDIACAMSPPRTTVGAHAPRHRTRVMSLEELPRTRLVAGAPIGGVAPLSARGFPAVSPDAIHVAMLDRGAGGALRLGVRRVDDGRVVVDEVLLAERESAPKKGETEGARQLRVGRVTSARLTKLERMLARVGFSPMTPAPPRAASVPFEVHACGPRESRALVRTGGVGPPWWPCAREGCAGQARVVSAWTGGDDLDGLRVEALEVELPAPCLAGRRWVLRRW